MNTDKKVFNKLFSAPKVELASEKFDFANMQDLSRIVSAGKSILTRGSQFINKKESLQKEAKVLNADSKALLTGGEKLINDFIKSAKDLGLDVNNIKEIQMAIDALGVVDTVELQTKAF
jgi:hypothetical protein